MSLEKTKEHLNFLLNEFDNKVIALTGKWGTGKSHLWNQVKAESDDPSVQSALYVSLFGLADMNQVKLKIVQGALPEADAHQATWEKIKIAVQGARKVLNSIHKGFTALDELALLAVPNILKSRTIVFDDIERKHEKLSIDEILGFIDEFTTQHSARFLLILNSDRLSDQKEKEIWDTLREKVVDQEIRLETTPSEAFDIAIQLSPSPCANSIREASICCSLTNIRITRKVIKTINRLFGERRDLSNELLARVVPSAVLLAAIHYKGIDNGPNIDFVLTHGSLPDWPSFLDQSEIEDSKTGTDKARWKQLLDDLGIGYCDEYESLVADFLRSGMFDAAAVGKHIDRYANDLNILATREELRQFYEDLAWRHSMSDADHLSKARELKSRVHTLDAYTFTSFHDAVSIIEGGKTIAEKMLADWIDSFRSQDHEPGEFENLFGRSLHPSIRAELEAYKAEEEANISVVDVCDFMVRNSGWNRREERILSNATVADFELAIRTVEPKPLRMFLRRMVELASAPGGHREYFGDATERFVQACRSILQDPTSPRLGRILQTLFVESNATHLLAPQSKDEA
jgi:hypothetical protein